MAEWIYFSQHQKDNALTRKQQLLMQNARFYTAFENSDIHSLESMWSHAADVKCIHPGWHLLEGWDAIRDSWETIFRAESNFKVSLRNVSARLQGKWGIVTLIEEITFATQVSIRSGAIMATNIFEHDGEEWKMIHHHGSPLMVAEQQESDEKYRYN